MGALDVRWTSVQRGPKRSVDRWRVAPDEGINKLKEL